MVFRPTGNHLSGVQHQEILAKPERLFKILGDVCHPPIKSNHSNVLKTKGLWWSLSNMARLFAFVTGIDNQQVLLQNEQLVETLGSAEQQETQ
jgi:hypothetical protein